MPFVPRVVTGQLVLAEPVAGAYSLDAGGYASASEVHQFAFLKPNLWPEDDGPGNYHGGGGDYAENHLPFSLMFFSRPCLHHPRGALIFPALQLL